MFKLEKETTALLVIDIQERLVPAMEKTAAERTVKNAERLIRGFDLLGAKVVYSQQYTKGLGETVPELKSCLKNDHLEKATFSCCADAYFMSSLKEAGIKTLVLTGMETHVCVLQTAVDLIEAGYSVHVAADAVCSRTEFNREAGLRFMEKAGAVITVTETVLFQLVKRAGIPEFKEISNLIK